MTLRVADRRSVALFCAIAALAGGCGNDGPSEAPASSDSLSGPEESALTAGIDEPSADTAGAPSPALEASLPLSFGRLWQPWLGDFAGMTERRVVRAVAPYGGYQFFYENGEPRGATWELLQRLEAFINEELGTGHLKVYVVVIPLARDRLIPALLDGYADLIAGDLTITTERAAQLTFSRPLREGIDEVVVTGPAAPTLESIDDLAGRRIVARASSSYFEHLETLAADFGDRGIDAPEIVAADEILEAEDLLEMVSSGMIPMTVMDDYKARFWEGVFSDIEVRADLVVNRGGSIAWAMRPENPQLAATIDRFLGKFGKGTMIGNDTFNRYLSDASRVRCSHSAQAMENLADLVDVFQTYGERYAFDWLMLAAQSFQESRFQQGRSSSAGAVGVMQIRPSTAADPNVGIDDVSTVDGNVHAGAKYMRFLVDRYFSSPGMDDLRQWLFALAAYNAGPARVAQLRREAADEGYDADVWFDNVEIIAARRIGRETPTYVSNVFKYYVGYQLTVERGQAIAREYGRELTGCAADGP